MRPALEAPHSFPKCRRRFAAPALEQANETFLVIAADRLADLLDGPRCLIQQRLSLLTARRILELGQQHAFLPQFAMQGSHRDIKLGGDRFSGPVLLGAAIQ